MSKRSVGLKIGLACVAMVGLVQAGLMTAYETDGKGQLTWQDIQSISYVDANKDGTIQTGEKVTFSITMHKQQYGDHDYDVLKVWIDGNTLLAPVTSDGTLLKDSGYPLIWDAGSNGNGNIANGGITKTFSFDYTFNTTGTHDFAAGVMCSADLARMSGLSLTGPDKGPSSDPFIIDGTKNDAPTTFDWSLWSINAHKDYNLYEYASNGWRLQGETERYRIPVTNVPEPSSFSLIFLGLASLAGSLAFRRKK